MIIQLGSEIKARKEDERFQKVTSTHDHPGGEIKVKTEGERFLTSDRASLPQAGGCGKIKAWQQMESGSVYFQQLRGNFLYISESVSERIRENFLELSWGKKSQAVTSMTSSTSITFSTPLDFLFCIPFFEIIFQCFLSNNLDAFIATLLSFTNRKFFNSDTGTFHDQGILSSRQRRIWCDETWWFTDTFYTKILQHPAWTLSVARMAFV